MRLANFIPPQTVFEGNSPSVGYILFLLYIDSVSFISWRVIYGISANLASLAIQPGLVRTWSETQKQGFLMMGLVLFSAEIIEHVNKVLKKYLGTHPFHNFTSGM